MPTKCTADSFDFAPVEGRQVVAAFDGGAMTSDAGAPASWGDEPSDRIDGPVRRVLLRRSRPEPNRA
jgi:hypothetical protein